MWFIARMFLYCVLLGGIVACGDGPTEPEPPDIEGIWAFESEVRVHDFDSDSIRDCDVSGTVMRLAIDPTNSNERFTRLMGDIGGGWWTCPFGSRLDSVAIVGSPLDGNVAGDSVRIHFWISGGHLGWPLMGARGRLDGDRISGSVASPIAAQEGDTLYGSIGTFTATRTSR